MARAPRVWWDDRERCWKTTVGGPISPQSGRPKPVRNREIGPPRGPGGPANRAQAEAWFADRCADEAAAVGRVRDPLFQGLVDRDFDAVAPTLAKSTLAGYILRLKKFAAFTRRGVAYGERPARSFRAGDYVRFLDAMKAAGFAPGYIVGSKVAIDAVMNWAARPVVDREPEVLLPGGNPFRGVPRPTIPAPPRRYTGAAARRAFFAYAFVRACRRPTTSPYWRFDRLTIALLRFLEATGCRPVEATRLEWGHIDWDAQVATLSGKATKRTGRPRVLPLTPPILRILRAIERLPGRHPTFVFTHFNRDSRGPGSGTDGGGIPWVTRRLATLFHRWRAEAIAAGLPIAATGPGALTLYSFRRDLGVDILRLTGNHADSAHVLGHSVRINEKHHAWLDDERRVELANRVAERRVELARRVAEERAGR